MASTKINSVQVLDSRIEPQPAPTYAVTIGPDQNQWYTNESSGLTQNSISFNNLTTLGKDRAFLDTFELGLKVQVKFKIGSKVHLNNLDYRFKPAPGMTKLPPRGMFMPQSFPFNTVCDQVQVNINGGAFFNNPSQIIRAKERYWDERKLQESYGNVCPCCKPIIQDESGYRQFTIPDMGKNINVTNSRSRMLAPQVGYASSSTGPFGTTNFSILPDYDPQRYSGGAEMEPGEYTLTVEWREPVMCSPFSSRYDATYGRPLYNVTSIDLQFKMFGSLRNMFMCLCPIVVEDWTVTLQTACLYYQVMTVTAPVPHDITVVPYRRYVPYITNHPNSDVINAATGKGQDVKFTSGVYTLNEVPTAIWIFAAPQLKFFQDISGYSPSASNRFSINGPLCNTSNRLFGFMKKLSISCGNTTQILNTATPADLYRIAKSNGCQDSFSDWSNPDPMEYEVYPGVQTGQKWGPQESAFTDVECGVWVRDVTDVLKDCCPGAGSVLRLIPGVDIVLPEQRLIPGANANSLVFQVQAEFDFDYGNCQSVPVALWVLFEYVGVAAFTPGNCMVTMNPLGNGGIAASSPVVAASRVEAPSTTEGSGWLDVVKNVFGTINDIAKKTHVISEGLSHIPGPWGEKLSGWAKKLGYGEAPMDDDGEGDEEKNARRANKRARDLDGGAIMGLGDFC